MRTGKAQQEPSKAHETLEVQTPEPVATSQQEGEEVPEVQKTLKRQEMPEMWNEAAEIAERVEAVREKRIFYGASQREFADVLGIQRESVCRIELGQKKPGKELLARMEEMIEFFNPEKEMQILFDYCRIRFPTVDTAYVIEEILQLKMKYMVEENHAFYGYSFQYILGDIVVMGSEEQGKGVLLELKGKGCRQFEIYLKAQGRSWYDFLLDAKAEGALIKRIDLAINDRAGVLNISELAEKCRNDECITLFRSFKNYQSGELLRSREDEADMMGQTLYLGSLKSEIYFCVYEKDYEQYVRNNIPLEETETKNRFEIRLKNERAEKALEDLLENRDVTKTAFGIINHYVRFVDPDEEKACRDWPLNERWRLFLDEADREIRLTVAPEPYTLDRALSWLSRQVAPTLKMACQLDELRGTTLIWDMVTNAKLSPQHLKILEQQTVSADEMIAGSH